MVVAAFHPIGKRPQNVLAAGRQRAGHVAQPVNLFDGLGLRRVEAIMNANFRRQAGALGIDHFDVEGPAAGHARDRLANRQMGQPWPGRRAKGIHQAGHGDPRGRRIHEDAGPGQQAHGGQRHGSPGSRPPIEHGKKVQWLGLRRGCGNHGLAECRGTGRRIVLGGVQELYRAKEPIAQAGKTPLDEQGQIDVAEAGEPDGRYVAVEAPAEHSQHQQRGDDPQAGVLEPQQVVGQPQDRGRGQHDGRSDAQSIDGRHSPHAASQGGDLLLERMGHGGRRQGSGFRG